jgi:hypothetical protein
MNNTLNFCLKLIHDYSGIHANNTICHDFVNDSITTLSLNRAQELMNVLLEYHPNNRYIVEPYK